MSNHSHHHEPGHSCVVPQASPDRAAELGRLRFLATKVAMVHGSTHPDMTTLAAILQRVANTPDAAIAANDRGAFAALTTNYTPWPAACGSVQGLFAGLRELPDVIKAKE